MFSLFALLKTRIQRWPFATITIVLVTLGFSVFQFAKIAEFQKSSESVSLKSGVWHARKNVLQHFCADLYLDQHCQFLKTLKAEEFADLSSFFKNYRAKFPDDNSDKRRAWKQWVSNEELEKTFNADAKSHSTFLEYKKALTIQRSLLAAEAKKSSLLVRGNTRWTAVAKSLFLHAGWVDLVMSLLVIALFATFLEQRTGSIGLAVIYLVSGMGANFLQASFIPFGTLLAGAGGPVSALLGAFVIYFYQEKSFILKKWAVPTFSVAGGFLFISLVVCWLAGSESVALAHGAGFALGAILASMQKDLFPLKKTMLFPHEQAMYYEAKKVARFEEKFELYEKILSLNAQSFYSFRSLFSYFEKHKLNLGAFKAEHQALVAKILEECFRCSRKSEKHNYAQQVLGLVPLSWNLNLLTLDVDANHIIECANAFQAKGFLAQSLRYYDFFLEKYAAHPRSEQAHAVIMQTFDELERFDPEFRLEMLEVLMNYAKAHPTTHFHSQIRRISQQVQKERSSSAA